MRTLRKKPTPGAFDYAGSHSAKRNLRDSARSRAFDNAGSHSAKRNLRNGRRSHAFDNTGSRSACATCAIDVVPVCLITQVHALHAHLARWTSFPGRSIRSRAGLVVEAFTNRQIRRGAVVSRARSLIVRDPRRSRLRRSTWSTISSALRARATSSALTCA